MADRILVGGNVHTLNPTNPRASAVAIRGRRILAVGDDASIQMLAEPGAAVDELGGRTVIPGLVDAHMHLEHYARALTTVDLFEVPSKAEAVRRVAERAAQSQPGEWITGWGWWQELWEGAAFPTAADLDAATPVNPVYLTAKSGHAAWVNGAALRLAGVTAATPDPEGGQIVRDAAGNPAGVLLENAIDWIADVVPEPPVEQVAAWIEAAQPHLWAAGLTGLHDFDGARCFAALQVLHGRGALGLRVVKNIQPAENIEHAMALGLRWGFGDDMLRIGGLKMFADGALGPATALMVEPYEGQPGNYGIAVTDKEALYEWASAASAAGLPSAIHAIGDRAVHDVLDIYERVRKEEAARGIAPDRMRHRIEHVQLVHPDDKARLAELGVIASMQPIHATGDRIAADRLWGERVVWSYNPRLQLEMGAVVVFGSDAPVEPVQPLWGIHAAVTRRAANGQPGPDGWTPDARITVDEALRAYTIGPAYAAGIENRLGQLKPGYLADLVVLGGNPYSIEPMAIRDINVAGTMVDGVWRHRAF
ncbi:MAG: amidohydrolase [Anaerolineae bacterium]|nr:amidohydrolase [Anaerolineae bacterium]